MQSKSVVDRGSDRFLQLKSSLLKQGRLFEDPEFPPGPSAIGSASFVRWKRPKDIVEGPKFVVDGSNRNDLHQGALRDCWFIAATACLAATHQELLARCIPPDQEFDGEYAGIFRFNFWHFDRWVEVIIDDFLPVSSGGRLMYGSNNSQPNEFWVPLFEKAYAKLYGSYTNLEGGFTNNALVDFTGGISEFIDIRPKRNSPDNFYDKLYAMMQKSSMIGCHIDIQANRIPENPLPNGLYTVHAYSITNLVRLKVKGSIIRLLRLRNPWGKGEWNGAWSDGSREWMSTPEEIKQGVGMVHLEDGEFWMCYEDWISNFEFVTICHLDPEATELESGKHKDRQSWNVEKHHGEWLKGFSAGGCGKSPYERLFWNNPQFGVRLQQTGNAQVNQKGQCHMLVSLMQKAVNQKSDLSINFFLYKLKENVPLLDGKNYDGGALELARLASTFINLREITIHYEIEPGNYVIIPCTFKPNESGEFLLRIYTEQPAESMSLDIQTTLSRPSAVEDGLQETFNRSTNGAPEMDAKELTIALNELMIKDGFNMKFGVESARNLLALLDKDRSGLLSVSEFRQLVKEVNMWMEKFQTFDVDRSGSIDTFELAQIFNSIGFKVSRQVLEAIVRRYGGKACQLSFEDFIHSCCKLVNLFNQFMEHSSGGISGKIELTMEQWLATTMYY